MMTSHQKAYRNGLIRLIHVARRELGLDEPTYRAVLAAHGGNASLAAMPLEGMQKVLDYFKAHGFKVRQGASGRRQATGKDAAKVRALWLFLHELGAVRDPSEAALAAYVKRVAQVDDVQWMRGQRKVVQGQRTALKAREDVVIETLKKWALRYLPAALQALQVQVCERGRMGLLSPEQLECAERGLRRLSQGNGFDVQWQAWENLRTAAGQPFPL